MNPLTLPWLEFAILTALIGSPVVSRFKNPERASRCGLTFTAITFACATLAWLAFYLNADPAEIRRLSFQPGLFGKIYFGLDELSAPLVPAVALIHLLTALATSRTHMRRFSGSWSLAAEAISLATFSTTGSWLLVGLLALSTIPPYVELANRNRPRRVYVLHMALFVGLLVIGYAAVSASEIGRAHV